MSISKLRSVLDAAECCYEIIHQDMLYLLTHDQNYVSEENITAFMEWYKQI